MNLMDVKLVSFLKPHKAQLLIGLSVLDRDKGISRDLMISSPYRTPSSPSPLHLYSHYLRTNMAAKNGTTDQIPVIDLSGPDEILAKELVHAAATFGFVYVKSLGKDIPLESIDSTFALVMPR
jgi:hypothetical protein